jgi:hypothetical protein
MGDLMAGLGNVRSVDLNLEIFDQGEISDTSRMFTTDHSVADLDSTNPRFTTIEKIQFPNRSWTIVIRSTPEFEAGFVNNTPTVVAFTGIAFSLLLTLLVLRNRFARSQPYPGRLIFVAGHRLRARKPAKRIPLPSILLSSKRRRFQCRDVAVARRVR